MQFNFKANEFLVEEITLGGKIVELDKPFSYENKDGEFIHIAIQKTNWTTADAIKQIAKKIRAGSQRFNWAGTKDRNATTTQLISCFGKSALEPLKNLDVKDIKILGIWTANKKIKLGDLKGNRFTITLTKTNCQVPEINPEKIEEKIKELNYFTPNYFGAQRFGIRNNSHKVGEHILKGNVEAAIWEILVGSPEAETNEIAKLARSKLNEHKNFAQAYEEFPRHLHLERDLLSHLKNHPNDFIGAFRKLQRQSLLIFVHAFQSAIFNELLQRRIKEEKTFQLEENTLVCELDEFGFPNEDKTTLVTTENKTRLEKEFKEGKIVALDELIGSETKLNPLQKELLTTHNVTQEMFKLPAIPELATKGSLKPRLVKVTNFAVIQNEPLVIQFTLPSGAYATTLIEQLIEQK